jgi:hypothetical protein
LRQISGRLFFSNSSTKVHLTLGEDAKEKGDKNEEGKGGGGKRKRENRVEESEEITPMLFMSLYISVIQDTTTILLGLRGVSTSSVNSGLGNIMINER